MIESPAISDNLMSAEERKASLERAVSQWVRGGWRVESRSDYQAVMVKGNRTNNVLHLILSLVTLGLWIPVWILVAVLGGEKRKVLAVDELGNAR